VTLQSEHVLQTEMTASPFVVDVLRFQNDVRRVATSGTVTAQVRYDEGRRFGLVRRHLVHGISSESFPCAQLVAKKKLLPLHRKSSIFASREETRRLFYGTFLRTSSGFEQKGSVGFQLCVAVRKNAQVCFAGLVVLHFESRCDSGRKIFF